MSVIVIVPAAGAGTRFGGEIPKQFRELGGKPIIQRVVEKFLLDQRVDRIIVPIAEVLVATIRPMDRVQFVAGGATRQESVTRGLEAAGDDIELVAVHDAVRPFFSIETFHRVLDTAREHGAAFPAMPLTDTVHVLDGDRVISTPERHNLAAAQTPQCFRIDVLRDVLSRGDDATDEAGLAAKYGYDVRVVPGDPMNFKITHADDLLRAEKLLAEES